MRTILLKSPFFKDVLRIFKVCRIGTSILKNILSILIMTLPLQEKKRKYGNKTSPKVLNRTRRKEPRLSLSPCRVRPSGIWSSPHRRSHTILHRTHRKKLQQQAQSKQISKSQKYQKLLKRAIKPIVGL